MTPLQYEIFKFKGVIKDIVPAELMNGSPPSPGVPTPAVWTHCNNIHFDDESTNRVRGYKQFSADLPNGLSSLFSLNVLTPTASYWIWIGDDYTVWVTDGEQHFDITPMSAELVTNGDFADSAGWTLEGSVTIANNVLTIPSSTIFRYALQTLPAFTGTDIEVIIVVDEISLEGIVIQLNALSNLITTTGTHVFTYAQVGAGTDLQISGASGTGGQGSVVSSISVKSKGTLTGSDVGNWTGTILNGVPVLNNGVDAPFWWDGNTANPVQTIPGWPANTTCKSIRAFKYHLIAMNITEDSVNIPEKVMWSDAADPKEIPQEWLAAPENEAGDNILADTVGGITDGESLRDNFILYKNHSCYIMSYVGGNFVFQFRPLFNTSGVQALNCIQEIRGKHYVFADDDLIVHDGNTFTSIADKKVRQFILNGVNPDTHHMAHVAASNATDEVWFMVPTIDSPSIYLAMVYSHIDGVWGWRELPNANYVTSGILPDENLSLTWDDSPVDWSQDPRFWNEASYSITNDALLMNGVKLYSVDTDITEDGQPVEAYVERTDWVMGGIGSIWQNKMIRSIYPTITGQAGDVIKVEVAGTSIPGEPVPWQSQDYVIGSNPLDEFKVDIMTHGRYLNLRFSSVGGSPWKIHRIGVEYAIRSKF